MRIDAIDKTTLYCIYKYAERSGYEMKKKWMSVFLSCIMVIGSLGMYTTAWGAEKPLDDATKAAYYAEYQKIVAEVAAETESDISLLPIEEFAEEDWKEPEEYRKFITAIANWNLDFDAEGISATEYEGEMAQEVIDIHNVANQNPADFTPLVVEKQVNVKEQVHSSPISVTGSFLTQYNDFTGRQEFSGLQEISSRAVDFREKWTQTGYEYQFIDCGRTCVVTLFGDLEFGGAIFPKTQKVEFYCSSTGGIE